MPQEKMVKRAEGQKEIWKKIPRYRKLYMVSNIGRVKALSRRVYNGPYAWIKEELILKPGIKNNGYKVVVLSNNAKKETFHVHTLVFLAFKNKKGNHKICINHINGIKTDNRIENLELISKGEDIEHAIRIGLMRPRCKKHSMRK